MTCHLKSLIFDCLIFTEGLITFLSNADGEAPDSNRLTIIFFVPSFAAK